MCFPTGKGLFPTNTCFSTVLEATGNSSTGHNYFIRVVLKLSEFKQTDKQTQKNPHKKVLSFPYSQFTREPPAPTPSVSC